MESEPPSAPLLPSLSSLSSLSPSPTLLLAFTLAAASLLPLLLWLLKSRPKGGKTPGTPPACVRRASDASGPPGTVPAGVRRVSDLPGPPGWPILGNLLEVSGKGYHVCHLEWMRCYGPMFKYAMGPLTVVVVSDPRLVREMATLQFKSFHDRPVPPTAAPTSDKGLLFARGDYWAGLRASLTPSLHNDSQVSLLLPHMASCARSLVSRLRALSRPLPGDDGEEQGGVVDILPVLEESAVDAIGMACFGPQQWHQPLNPTSHQPGSDNSASTPAAKYAELGCPRTTQNSASTPAAKYAELERTSNSLGAATQLLLLLCPGPLRPALRWILSRVPGLNFRESLNLRASLFAEWQARLGARRDAPEGVRRSGHDLVEPLSRACVKGTKDPLTDSDITAALFNLIGAGSGTTATTIACALHFLALDPGAQEKAALEADRVLGKWGGGGGEGGGKTAVLGGKEEVEGTEPSVVELGSMPFLDAVVKETLRLCPPGALLAREAGCDVTLGDCWLPKGTPVLAPVYAMHRNEDYFGQPEKFLPERFYDQTSTSGMVPSLGGEGGFGGGIQSQGAPLWTPSSASAYVPFGLGPRMCLGQKYAMLECKLFLATILHSFQVRAPHGTPELTLAAGINLKPKHGVKLLFAERREHTVR